MLTFTDIGDIMAENRSTYMTIKIINQGNTR